MKPARRIAARRLAGAALAVAVAGQTATATAAAAPAVAGVPPAALPAASPSVPPAPDVALLAGGAVHVTEVPSGGLPGKSFVAWTLVAAPVPRLCAMVQDYPSYAAYMPNTKSAQPVSAGDGYVLVDMTLDLPLGQEKKYRLRLEPLQPDPAQCKLAWRLVPSGLATGETIADTTGYWLFKPLPGDSAKTLVEYQVYADPGPVPFGFGWIVDMMSKRSLPRTLEALRNYSTQR